METIKLKKEKTMAINITAPELRELKPRIVVLGVGGAGGNAIMRANLARG